MQLLSRNLAAVYSNRVLIQFGLSLIAVFLPTFFFLETGGSLWTVIWIYVAAYALHGILTPLSAKLISLWGMKKLMALAVVPFLVIAVGALAFWDYAPAVALLLYVVGWAIYRALYWVPYQVEVSSFLDKKRRGRQVSLFLNANAVALALAPFIGGLVIDSVNFTAVFVLACVVFFLATIPLFLMEETFEEYSFKFFQTFRILFRKDNRKLLVAYAGDGAQAIVQGVFWPIFIFLLLDGDFLAVGLISALVVLATLVLQFVTGEFLDSFSRKQILIISSVVYTTGWFLKVFAQTATHIFLFDAYHNAGKAVNRVSFDAGTYEQMADNGRYVDEFTALKEIAMNVGRIIMLIGGGLLATLFGLKIAFLLAAGASLLMVLLSNQITIRT